MKVDSSSIKNLSKYVKGQTKKILKMINSKYMAEEKDFFIKEIRELSKKVSVLFKDGEMV